MPSAAAAFFGWAILAIGPLVVFFLGWLNAGANTGELNRILPAFFNSLVVGLVATLIAIPIAFGLVLCAAQSTARKIEAVFFVVALLLVPGELVAQGIDRLLALAGSDLANSKLSVLALVFALSGYALPFIVVSLFGISISMRTSEKMGVAELLPNYWSQMLFIFKARHFDFWTALLVGTTICLAESSRSRVLGRDFMENGSQFFGPTLVDGLNSRGLDHGFMFAGLMLVTVSLVMVLGLRFWGRNGGGNAE